jgi:hypothetical protein
MMANKEKKHSVQVFYRVVKAEHGHPFAGLYAVEKVFVKDDSIYKKEIVHEWDMRLISEAILARLGGGDAYESYKLDHEIAELEKDTSEVEARTAEDLKDLTAKKLAKELTLKLPKE